MDLKMVGLRKTHMLIRQTTSPKAREKRKKNGPIVIDCVGADHILKEHHHEPNRHPIPNPFRKHIGPNPSPVRLEPCPLALLGLCRMEHGNVRDLGLYRRDLFLDVGVVWG